MARTLSDMALELGTGGALVPYQIWPQSYGYEFRKNKDQLTPSCPMWNEINVQQTEKKLGKYDHRCSYVTAHRGDNFVCQKAGCGVSKDAYCYKCTIPEAVQSTKPRYK